MKRKEKEKKRGLMPEESILLTFIAGIYLFDSIMENRMLVVILLTAYISFWLAANFGTKKHRAANTVQKKGTNFHYNNNINFEKTQLIPKGVKEGRYEKKEKRAC